jgi:hypothetical protein
MTIRDEESFASAPTEAEIMNSVNGDGINTERTVEAMPVMDPYEIENYCYSNVNVPFASDVGTIGLQHQSSAYGNFTTTTTAGIEDVPFASDATTIGLQHQSTAYGSSTTKTTAGIEDVPFASDVGTIGLQHLSSAYGSSTTTTTAGIEDVPFASDVGTIGLQHLSSAYGSSTTTTTARIEPKPRAITPSTAYIATGAPIIRAAQTQSAPTVPPTQKHSGNQDAGRNNNQGSRIGLTCCCKNACNLILIIVLWITPFMTVLFIFAMFQEPIHLEQFDDEFILNDPNVLETLFPSPSPPNPYGN